jgi:hypothetical protein
VGFVGSMEVQEGRLQHDGRVRRTERVG